MASAASTQTDLNLSFAVHHEVSRGHHVNSSCAPRPSLPSMPSRKTSEAHFINLRALVRECQRLGRGGRCGGGRALLVSCGFLCSRSFQSSCSPLGRGSEENRNNETSIDQLFVEQEGLLHHHGRLQASMFPMVEEFKRRVLQSTVSGRPSSCVHDLPPASPDGNVCLLGPWSLQGPSTVPRRGSTLFGEGQQGSFFITVNCTQACFGLSK